MHNFGELRHYAGIPAEGPVGETMQRDLVHGYQACVSYTDAQVGRLLDELDRLGLRENTVVILWGDHGWHLGEHGLWCKHCNFDKVMRVPMILSAPGYPHNTVATSMVEFVDIYPTLAELAGLPAPSHLQGDSLVPLLEDPTTPLKDAAFSRWFDGETVITERYIYTEWLNQDRERYARMLYDLEADPGENVNIAERPENQAVTDELSAMIAKNFAETMDLEIPTDSDR
jgi:arylsulfatase A-like enzyme